MIVFTADWEVDLVEPQIRGLGGVLLSKLCDPAEITTLCGALQESRAAFSQS